ncbi:MAG: serine/threonine protein kinase, partial [Bacillota bacterium]
MAKKNSFISFQKNNIEIKIKSSLSEKWLDLFIEEYCHYKDDEIKKGETIYNIRNQITKVSDPI